MNSLWKNHVEKNQANKNNIKMNESWKIYVSENKRTVGKKITCDPNKSRKKHRYKWTYKKY